MRKDVGKINYDNGIWRQWGRWKIKTALGIALIVGDLSVVISPCFA